MPRRWNHWQSAAQAAATSKVVAGAPNPYLARVSQPDIILTENAAKRVALIAARQGKPAILRLAVDGGGCAGFTYKFELVDEAGLEDAVAEAEGAKLVVDPISLEMVKGSAVDFVEDLAGAAFRVTNPNAQSGCGCGSSFSV
jgi:iron-sulfur cluster insertion protein